MATAKQMEDRLRQELDPFRKRLLDLSEKLGQEGRSHDARLVKNAVKALLSADDLVEDLRARMFILELQVEALADGGKA